MNWFWSPGVILFKNILSKDRIYHVFPNCLFSSFSETSGETQEPKRHHPLEYASFLHSDFLLQWKSSYLFSSSTSACFECRYPNLILSLLSKLLWHHVPFLPSSNLMLAVGSTCFPSTCL